MSRQNYLMAERYVRPFGNALRDMFSDRTKPQVQQHINQMAANPMGGLNGDFRQRMATASMMGFPVVSDVAGLAADAMMYKDQPQERTVGNFLLSGLGALPFVPGMTAYHGSPHKFDKFDSAKIGTGEGAQAYGHGLYLAEAKDVARNYKNPGGPRSGTAPLRIDDMDASRWMQAPGRTEVEKRAADSIARNRNTESAIDYLKQDADHNPTAKAAMGWIQKNDARINKPGMLYKVDLPDEHINKMLDWDAPLSEQPESVRKALAAIGVSKNKDAILAARKQAFADFDAGRITKADRDALLSDGGAFSDSEKGSSIYNKLMQGGSQEAASARLREAGVPGIKYRDGFSRGPQGGSGTRNFVVFDDSILKILKRE